MNANSTPSANVALVQKLYTHFGQGNIPAILEELGDQMEWHVMGAPLLTYAGDYKGQAIGQFFQGLGQTLDITEFAPLDFVEHGDDLIAFGVIGGTARATGQSFRSKWIMHWKFQNGHPCYFQDYLDTANLYAATLAVAQPIGL
jgi:ketosteroid isomerase-like protein